jgi:hypothetical protein
MKRENLILTRGLKVVLTEPEVDMLRDAHEPQALRPYDNITPIYNFVEEVLYGDTADLVEIPTPDPPAG